MEVLRLTRKKKAKSGFKFAELLRWIPKKHAKFACVSLRKGEKFALNSLEKCEKSAKISSKNVIDGGEYCPKITGCCWDHLKKQEDKVAS